MWCQNGSFLFASLLADEVPWVRFHSFRDKGARGRLIIGGGCWTRDNLYIDSLTLPHGRPCQRNNIMAFYFLDPPSLGHGLFGERGVIFEITLWQDHFLGNATQNCTEGYFFMVPGVFWGTQG